MAPGQATGKSALSLEGADEAASKVRPRPACTVAEALATALPGQVADPAASLAPPLPSAADPGAGVQAGVWSRSEAARGRCGPSRPAPSHSRSSSSSQLQVQLTYGT